MNEELIEETMNNLSNTLEKIADAITPVDAAAGNDETGGYVSSLTEAVMGVTKSLCKIADAISDLADAVRDYPSP